MAAGGEAGTGAVVAQGGSSNCVEPVAGVAGIGEEEAVCVAFCSARQLHIQHCTERDGERALREDFDDCLGSAEAVEFGLCQGDPSCGGWLAGCLSDAKDADLSVGFPPGTTCADSVAAGRFRPSASP